MWISVSASSCVPADALWILLFSSFHSALCYPLSGSCGERASRSEGLTIDRLVTKIILKWKESNFASINDYFYDCFSKSWGFSSSDSLLILAAASNDILTIIIFSFINKKSDKGNKKKTIKNIFLVSQACVKPYS